MQPLDKIAARIDLVKDWTACGIIFLLTAVAALSFQLYPTNVLAQPAHHYAASGGVSLDEAVSRVRRQTNGKILSADTVRIDGRSVHIIKVLTPDGRVKRIRVNAGGRGG